MRRLILVLFFSSYVFTSNANNDLEISGTVSSVFDGNTIEITDHNNEIHKVMLSGIDCPELTQEYGVKAKNVLGKLLLQRNVIAHVVGRDRSGQYLAEIFIDGKLDPRIELLKEGLAWTTERNPLPELEEHRTKAQQKGRGLWKQADPTPPWIFRREQSMLQPKSR